MAVSLNGVHVVFDGADCALLARLLPSPSALRRDGRRLSAAEQKLVEQIERAARSERQSQPPNRSDLPLPTVPTTEIGRGCKLDTLSTTQVAEQLGTSSQWVLKLLKQRHLGGSKVNGIWQIDAVGVSEYEKSRDDVRADRPSVVQAGERGDRNSDARRSCRRPGHADQVEELDEGRPALIAARVGRNA